MANNKGFKPGFVFPPQDETSPAWKIEITADDSTVYTVMDTTDTSNPPINNDVITGSISKRSTNALSSFTLVLSNDDGKFTNIFDGGETIQIYGDFLTATNLVFRGKIDNVIYSFNDNGFKVNIEGRDYPELADKTVIETFAISPIDYAIKKILTDYFDDITFTFWEDGAWKESGYSETFTEVTVNYRNQTGINSLGDLCYRGSYDSYLEYDGGWYLRVFTKETITNTDEHILQGQNLLSLNGFGTDNDLIKNRIVVYGKEENNMLLLKTEEDTTSQSNLWIKELIINDSRLQSMEEAEEKAEVELADKKDSETKGSISSIILPTLNAGEMIECNVPNCSLTGTHKIIDLTHSLSKSGFTTQCTIKKKEDSIAALFKERIDVEEALSPYTNLRAMDNSILLYFDGEQSLTLTNCEEVESKLVLSSGESSGIMTTPIFTIDDNVLTCEFRVYSNYPNTEDDTYEVSNDGGGSFETITPGTLHTFTSVGRSLVIRITLASVGSNTPSYDAVTLLYK